MLFVPGILAFCIGLTIDADAASEYVFIDAKDKVRKCLRLFDGRPPDHDTFGFANKFALFSIRYTAVLQPRINYSYHYL